MQGEFNINSKGNLNISASRVNINSGLFVRGDIGGNQSISAVGNITAQKSLASQVSVETKGYLDVGTTAHIVSDVTVDAGVKISNDCVASGISLVNHVHGGVQSGGSKTSKPQ